MSQMQEIRLPGRRVQRRRAGALTGLGAGTPVLTLDGEIPVEHLTEGDRVVTRSGARRLRRITARLVEGGFRVSPHRLGQGRPEAAVVLGPRQKILLRDWRARALAGGDTALMPVARLADGDYIAKVAGPLRLWRL
jgi:hypothetical protein